MNPLYRRVIRDYLDQHRPDLGRDDIHTIIDFLFECYIERNPLINDESREGFSKLDELAKDLSLGEDEEVFNLVVDLAYIHVGMAFRQGIRAGVMLALELGCDE